MTSALKSHLAEKYGLAKDADDAAATALASEKIKSGDLALEKYTELLNSKAPESPKDKLAEMLKANAQETATATAAALAPTLDKLAEVLKSRQAETPPVTPPATDDGKDFEAIAKDMESRLAKKFGIDLSGKTVGNDGAKLMSMALDDASDDGIRVKGAVERYRHDPKTLCYGSKNDLKKHHARLLGIEGQPMQYNGKNVELPTDRTKAMSAVWLKFQLMPEYMKDWELDIVRHILHKEPFLLPNSQDRTDARLLTEEQRNEVYKSYMNFYKAPVLNDSTSGGQYAVPEFFDYDMIVTPTLANEDIPSYCNVVPVPRGSAAANFTMGRPTVAAHTEGTGVTLFTTTAFIGNHDTTFFRAMGAIEIGKNFLEDANPRILAEIQNQYMNSVKLWFNEQITTGDGTTEPQGIMNASGTTNVTPTTPTSGPIVIADLLAMLFGVSKAYRNAAPARNAIYIMTDTCYRRVRAIATGVTGDTRFVLGNDVESYEIFGHPVLIEQAGMTNDNMIFAQMKGYRLYIRQGARFFREDRGVTLVKANDLVVGVDVRAGGQLDLGGYAAVATGFIP